MGIEDQRKNAADVFLNVIQLRAAVTINIDGLADALDHRKIQIGADDRFAFPGGGKGAAPGIVNMRGTAVNGIACAAAGIAGNNEDLVFNGTGSGESVPVEFAQCRPLSRNKQNIQAGQGNGAY